MTVSPRARARLPLLALLACAIRCSAASPYAYTMSADRFLDMMRRPEPLSAYDYMQREKAYSYIDGVRDSAEGRVWCDLHQVKTPDLADELALEIGRLPPPERKKKNASILLLDLLHRKFPCKPNGVSQP